VHASNSDESPLVSAFRNDETVAHLESLMGLDPGAMSWRFEVSCTSMGNWIEDQTRDIPNPRWSTQWRTGESASVLERLTPPIGAVESLSAHLIKVQVAHTEAVGGPMDGVGYHLEVHKSHTTLDLLY
jgi:hypothetical protein